MVTLIVAVAIMVYLAYAVSLLVCVIPVGFYSIATDRLVVRKVDSRGRLYILVARWVSIIVAVVALVYWSSSRWGTNALGWDLSNVLGRVAVPSLIVGAALGVITFVVYWLSILELVDRGEIKSDLDAE